MSNRLLTVAPILTTMLLFAVGCHVDAHSSEKGDNVKIATPFGGVSVKTDDTAVTAGTGLPTYPGAVIDRRKHSDDKHGTGAADVNMRFGDFQLRAKAVSFRTTDPPAKVLAFYRPGLARFGTVIQCSGKQPVGTPTRTPEGLTCADDYDGSVKVANDSYGTSELKTGSSQHQHIVSIDPDGTGTKFALIALDLSGIIPSAGDTDDSSKAGRSQ